MIAAYLGNIVGAMFVALPYTYFYLLDYHPDTTGLAAVEEGEVFNEMQDGGSNNSLRKRES